MLLAIRAVDRLKHNQPRFVVEGRFNHIAREFSNPKIFSDALTELWEEELYAILDDEAPHYFEGLTSRGEALALKLIAENQVADLSDDVPEVHAESVAWTGKFELSPYQVRQIRTLLERIRDAITAAKLPNSQTANAVALVEAAERLIDTPDPLWPEIVRLLRSPTLAGIVGVAGLVMALAQILLSVATS